MASINRLFKLEVRFMWAVVVVPLVLGIAAAIVVPQVREQFEIDRCLDAGGSYEREAQHCVLPPSGK